MTRLINWIKRPFRWQRVYCRDCRFYDGHSRAGGDCRRRKYPDVGWPFVEPADWCGDGRRK